MNPHTSHFKSLRDELRLYEGVQSGREAMQRFQTAGVEIGDMTSLVELANSLDPESMDPVFRANLEILIGLSPKDHKAAVVVLVAFEPVFVRIAKLIHRAGPTALDVNVEVLAAAWEAMVEAAQLPRSERVKGLVSKTWTKSRTVTRREHRLLSQLDVSDEIPERIAEGDSMARALGDLRDWVSLGLITEVDAELLRHTRIDGLPLDVYAEMIGVTHCALKHRRSRVEAALRSALSKSDSK